ncbi:MAG: hypothetical protein ABI614_17285 [Planctomycetota bacterium]
MVRVLLTIAFMAFAGCGNADEPQDSPPATAGKSEPIASPRAAILSSISTNSDKRCVGISLVAEALLDGLPVEGDSCDEADDVAARIYDSLTSKRQLRYLQRVSIEGTCVPLISTEAIDKISTLVAEKYKQDFSRLMTTEDGRRKLLAAQDSFVATASQLDRILDADSDKLDAFFGSGVRRFPDGTVEDTYHAFLIGKGQNGALVVYDANDPGLPIECKLLGGESGVAIEWTCRYRDTGQTTTQHYLIVPKDRFFHVMLGE